MAEYQCNNGKRVTLVHADEYGMFLKLHDDTTEADRVSFIETYNAEEIKVNPDCPCLLPLDFCKKETSEVE